MNTHLGRLLLVGVCCLIAATSAPAQPGRFSDDNDAHPSHRPLGGGVGDLAGAEDQLARRLHLARDRQDTQDLVKSLLDDDQFREMLKQNITAEMAKKNIKDMNPEDLSKHIDDLKEMIRNNPKLLDDPNLRDVLKDVEKFKKDGKSGDVSPQMREDVAKWAKDLVIDKQKASDPNSGNPMTGGPMMQQSDPPAPTRHPDPPAPKPSPPQEAAKPGGWGHDLLHGMAGLVKDINGTPEGEALRTEALREIAKWDSKSSGSSSSLADFLKGVVSSDQASWLSQSWKTPSGPGLGAWNSGAASALPSFGGSSAGMMDGVLGVAALALLVMAGWMAVAVARRRAGRARAAAWSPGPWPIPPSQVSTRQDLIRAFEHLAYLLIGRNARSLNHRDVAARLALPPLPSGERGGGEGNARTGAADRLGRLYEQARYAPPDETLPAHELTAARADLAALAGAAA